MKRFTRKILVLGLVLVLFLAGCRENTEEKTVPASSIPAPSKTAPQAQPETIPVKDDEAVSADGVSADSTPAPQGRALLIYMVGSDLESDRGLASADIDEILGCENLAEGFQIYLCTGGSPFWWNPEIPEDACTIFSVEDGSLIPLASRPDCSMADPATITWFLDNVETDPSARQLSLIFWNHGGGIIMGYGADANYDFDIMSVPRLQRAIAASAFCESGGCFSFIGFDACLMGMAEVADLLQNTAAYLVASEEVEPGTGWDYSFVETLSLPENASGEKAGAIIAASYEAAVVSGSPYEIDYTISVLNLSETDHVTEALGNLMERMGENLSVSSYSKFARLRRHSRSFGNRSGSSFDSMDLQDFARSVSGLYPAESQALQRALNAFVICNKTNMDNANGVAVYFPYDNKEDAAARLEQYASLEFCSPYTSFICAFHSMLSGEAMARWTVGETTPQVENETLFMSLDPEQAGAFSQAYSMIWEDLHENGEYKCWYRGGSCDLKEDGKLYSSFDGRIFRLVDDTSGDYAPCMVMETDRTEESVTYRTVLSIIRVPEVPAALKGTSEGILAAAAWEFYTVNAYITVDNDHPDGHITGMYVTGASKAGYPDFLPSVPDFTIEEGDIVQCFQLCRRITYDDDGRVRPFSEWEDLGVYRGNDFTAGGSSIRVETVPLDGDTDYCCVFSITDTQQNTYMSDLVPMK